jgi:thiamine-phosphate pyrophosphorylase
MQERQRVESAVVRILDANLNRAREALRVVEDHARFVLDDADAAERVKIVRHRLRRIVDAVGADELLTARDIVSDVGRDVKTAGELRRGSAEDVVRAAFARLTEAARVLGEYGKLVTPAAAEAAEKLRYETYELEQRVVLRGTLRARLQQVGLYVILTEALCARGWYETAEAVLRGGAGGLQLREKNLGDAQMLARARRLRDLTTQYEALLVINDRPDIARLSGADGVHVGQDDLPVADARRIAGANILVGKSTHTLEQFDAAAAEEPDYLAIGPMFASTTKPQDHIAGSRTLAAVAGKTQLPLIGIGGITAENVAQVMEGGATCVCVCSAVIGADDAEGAAAEIVSNIVADGRSAGAPEP